MTDPFALWPDHQYLYFCRRFPERLVLDPATGREQIGRVCYDCGAAYLSLVDCTTHQCPQAGAHFGTGKPLPPWLEHRFAGWEMRNL